MDDWGLQAVVRGYCNTTTTAISEPSSLSCTEDPSFFFNPSFVAEEAATTTGTASSFSDFLSSSPSVELDDLWKPFYVSSSSTNQSFPAIRQSHQQRPPSLHEAASHSQPRSKRRKSQQKRVVCHVPAEGQASSDVWAWRKYGQKPIKGSPYPRGYYRCSSSKGCLARKQVERSRTDPAMLVITYTGEHSHPVPTHRNSLAGSTRQKYSDHQNTATAPATTTPNSESGGRADGSNAACLLTANLSPTTPLMAVMEEASKIQLDDDEPEMEAGSVGETDDSDMFLALDELHDDMFMDGLDDCFPTGFPLWDGRMATTFG